MSEIPKWDDTIEYDIPKSPGSMSGPSWDSTEEIPEIGKFEAGVRGALQGVTFGFGDELSAYVESLISDTPYETERDRIRERNRLAREQHPWIYGTTDILGGVAPAVLSGGGSLAVKGGVTAGKAAAGQVAKQAGKQGVKELLKRGGKRAALEGAAAGLGYSEGENAEEILKDAALGAGIGLGGNAAFNVAGKGIKSGIKKLSGSGLGKKALSVAGDVPEEAIDRYIKRGSEVNEMMGKTAPLKDITERVSGQLDDLGNLTREKSAKAFDVLKDTGETVSKKEIDDIFDQGVDFVKNRAAGKEARKGIKDLMSFKDEIISDTSSLNRGLKSESINIDPTEFNPKKFEIMDQIEKLKKIRESGDIETEYRTLKELVDNDPAKSLSKYVNKRTQELPEVLGDSKSQFSKEGDVLTSNLGYEDSETARLAFQNYRENVARLKDLSEILKKPSNEIKILKNEISQLENKIPKEKIQNTSVLPIDRVKAIIQGLDDEISTGEKFGAARQVQAAKMKVRNELNELLRARSPEYASIMDSLASDVNVLKEAKSTFRADDTLMNRLADIGKGKNTFKTEKLQRLDDYLGAGFSDELKDAWAADQFNKNTTRGSRSTMAGFAAGGMGAHLLGVPYYVGAGLGAFGGFLRDRYGTKWTKTFVDRVYRPLSQNTKSFGRFEKVLKKAQEKGIPSLAMTHAILYKRSSDYREMIDNMNQENEPEPRSGIRKADEY